jgi:hypothetical protein
LPKLSTEPTELRLSALTEVSGQTGYDVLAEDTAPSAIPDFLLGLEKLQPAGAAR